MELPFPGMDPYLEATYLWPSVHHRLITAIANQLQPQLGPQYISDVTTYTLVETVEVSPPRFVPDVVILEREKRSSGSAATAVLPAPITNAALLEVPTPYARLEIRTIDGNTLVTAIEVLSPANKRSGQDGAEAYEKKRQELFNTSAHLLELDLLRAGMRPRFAKPLPDSPYFIFLSRAQVRPRIDVWPLSLREEIPLVPVPLLYPDPDIVLDLGKVMREIYQQAAYERRIDYSAEPPAPELSAEDTAWLHEYLKSKGLRA
jgi:Protein of unknown function (DUF4058)